MAKKFNFDVLSDVLIAKVVKFAMARKVSMASSMAVLMAAGDYDAVREAGQHGLQ